MKILKNLTIVALVFCVQTVFALSTVQRDRLEASARRSTDIAEVQGILAQLKADGAIGASKRVQQRLDMLQAGAGTRGKTKEEQITAADQAAAAAATAAQDAAATAQAAQDTAATQAAQDAAAQAAQDAAAAATAAQDAAAATAAAQDAAAAATAAQDAAAAATAAQDAAAAAQKIIDDAASQGSSGKAKSKTKSKASSKAGSEASSTAGKAKAAAAPAVEPVEPPAAPAVEPVEPPAAPAVPLTGRALLYKDIDDMESKSIEKIFEAMTPIVATIDTLRGQNNPKEMNKQRILLVGYAAQALDKNEKAKKPNAADMRADIIALLKQAFPSEFEHKVGRETIKFDDNFDSSAASLLMDSLPLD
jgi:hypothetical protein